MKYIFIKIAFLIFILSCFLHAQTIEQKDTIKTSEKVAFNKSLYLLQAEIKPEPIGGNFWN